MRVESMTLWVPPSEGSALLTFHSSALLGSQEMVQVEAGKTVGEVLKLV